MSQVARALQTEDASVAGTLQALTTGAVDEVVGAQHAGISLITARGRVQNRVLPGVVSPTWPHLHGDRGLIGRNRTGALPAVFPRRDHGPSRGHGDGVALAAFRGRAAELGVGSMPSFPLFVDAENLGALNLCAAAPEALDEQATEVGLIFAAHAAIALMGSRHEQRPMIALDSRDLIGQAKGILVERYRCSLARAFAFLVRTSQNTSVKLPDIDEKLSATGLFDH